MVRTGNKKACNKVGLLCKRISNYQETDGGNDKGQEKMKKKSRSYRPCMHGSIFDQSCKMKIIMVGKQWRRRIRPYQENYDCGNNKGWKIVEETNPNLGLNLA